MKVVINGCFGGFSLSLAAVRALAELGHEPCQEVLKARDKEPENDLERAIRKSKMFDDMYHIEIERNDARLVEVVERLQREASGACGALCVVEIPDDVKWHIEEYDGLEHVAEDHRTWRV